MPQTFPRDPNALSILLGAQPKSYAQYSPEAELGDTFSDEDIFDAQDEQANAGAASGNAYFIPSRESLRKSKGSELLRMFQKTQAQGEAAALPKRVEGEYGLRKTDLEGRYGVAKVREEADAAASRQSREEQFKIGDQSRTQAFTAEQSGLTRGADAEKARLDRGGRMGVARETSRRTAATQQAISSRQPSMKNEFWGPDSIMRQFWGIPDKEETAPANNAATIAQAVRTDNPDITLDDAIDMGLISFDTPEELAALEAAWGQ